MAGCFFVEGKRVVAVGCTVTSGVEMETTDEKLLEVIAGIIFDHFL